MELDALQTAIAGGTINGRGLAMWLPRGVDQTLNVSLRFPTPLRVGDVLPMVVATSTTGSAQVVSYAWKPSH